MEKLTIKLLHERRSSNSRRKVDGLSGKLYHFMWSDEHKAYCFTTSNQEEADDLFNSQGRAMGSYFAPVITIAPKAKEVPLPDELIMELIERSLDLPVDRDLPAIGKALVAAYEKGLTAGRIVVPPAPSVESPSASTPPRRARAAQTQQPSSALNAVGV